jgi:hypothetical protein
VRSIQGYHLSFEFPGGVGLKVYSSNRTAFSLSGGAGGVLEEDEVLNVRSSGTLNAGQRFSFKLSETAKLTQSLTGMWKTQELADALYHKIPDSIVPT